MDQIDALTLVALHDRKIGGQGKTPFSLLPLCALSFLPLCASGVVGKSASLPSQPCRSDCVGKCLIFLAAPN